MPLSPAAAGSKTDTRSVSRLPPPAVSVDDNRSVLVAAASVELAPGVQAMLVTGYTAALDVLRTPETFSKDCRRWRALNE